MCFSNRLLQQIVPFEVSMQSTGDYSPATKMTMTYLPQIKFDPERSNSECRSSYQRCSIEKLIVKISQNLAKACKFILKNVFL